MTAVNLRERIAFDQLHELRQQVIDAARAAGFRLSQDAIDAIDRTYDPGFLRVELAICETARREGWFAR